VNVITNINNNYYYNHNAIFIFFSSDVNHQWLFCLWSMIPFFFLHGTFLCGKMLVAEYSNFVVRSYLNCFPNTFINLNFDCTLFISILTAPYLSQFWLHLIYLTFDCTLFISLLTAPYLSQFWLHLIYPNFDCTLFISILTPPYLQIYHLKPFGKSGYF
jgi:predicted small integral membrane protein